MGYVLLQDRAVTEWADHELAMVHWRAREECMTDQTLRNYVIRLVEEVQRLRVLQEKEGSVDDGSVDDGSVDDGR